MSQSLNIGYFGSELLPLMGLKVVRDIPFIIILSTVLSITYTLNSLHKTSEAIIFSTAGISEISILRLLSPLILFIAIILILFSFHIVPTAKYEIQIAKSTAESRPDFIFFKPGIFQSFNDNNLFFYTTEINNDGNKSVDNLGETFLFSKDNDKLVISKSGKKTTKDSSVDLILYNGNLYENFTSFPKVSSFKTYSFNLFSANDTTPNVEYSPEMKDTLDLLNSSLSEDLNELRYRFEIILAFLILSFLSIFFSKHNNRKKHNFSLGYTLISFLLYYNFLIYAKTNFEEFLLGFSIYFYPHIFFIILTYLVYRFRIKHT